MKTFLCIILLATISFSCQKELSSENIVATLPTLTTTAATSITSSAATSGGNITDDGGAAITARGVCWSTSPNPVVTGNHTTDGTGIGIFASNITGLTATTVYYVRAYATNSAGTAYGNELSFTTTNTSTATATVLTASISAITMTTATSGGNVVTDGGAAVTVRGVCWSTAPNPTIALSTKTTDGAGTGVFTSAITGLTAGTTYHLRAYATNSIGTAYGGDSVFTTSSVPTIPAIVTTAISAITNVTANSGGTISSDGGAAVTVRGVCWSTTANPTIALSTKTTDGSGIGTFTSAITGLTANTTYHVRAYATNSVGTAYGNDVSFTTTGSSGPDVYVAGISYDAIAPNGMATVWKNGIATTLTNGVNEAEARKVFVSGTDVYVLVRETIGTTLTGYVLKNGAPYNIGGCSGVATAGALFVSGTDIYVAGVCSGVPAGTQVTIWKNGVISSVINGTALKPCDLFVSGTDVYVCGEENGDQKLWKNSVATTIAVNTPIPAGWDNSVFVSGTDVYVAFNSNDPNNIPKMWKNGVVTNLTITGPPPDISLVSDVHVSGADVYAVGVDPFMGSSPFSRAAIWKNGVSTQLTNGSDFGGAESVFVFGSDVYVAGNDGSQIRLWKNGVAIPPSGAPNAAYAYSVFVK